MSSDPYSQQNFDFNPYAATRDNLSSPSGRYPTELKHTGVGIASFIISVISGLMLIVLVIIAGVMEASSPDGLDEESTDAIIVGLGLIGFMFGALLGLVLGIVGVFQSRRKKIFAILGMLLGGLTFFGVLGLMVIGLAAE
jgi:hypothetical protein